MTPEDLAERVRREVLHALAEASPAEDAAVDAAKDTEWACAGGTVSVAREAAAPDLAPLIDHTLLRPDATRADVERLCAEARELGCATVCVQPGWVRTCAERLAGSRVRVCTVIGFPHGMSRTETKAFEARCALRDGATELDMVIALGALKSGDWDAVRRDVRAVVETAGPRHRIKVILENAFLSDAEKRLACALAKAEGAHFVKTSTGFGPSGATVEDVMLMRDAVGPGMGVKAAGGIHDAAAARRMIAAGATRLGTSASVRIVRGTAA